MFGKIIEDGNRYGRLVVLREARKRSGGHVCWHCRCDCGKYTVVDGVALRRGNTRSCGCYHREIIGNLTRGTRRPKSVRQKVAAAHTGMKRVYNRDGSYCYVKGKPKKK